MQDALAGLEPARLWTHFSNLSDIPRKSQHEAKVLDYVRALAARRGAECVADAKGNLLVRVKGTKGYEGSPTVALQGHVDMVCQANQGTTHDFLKDPIRLVRDGEWIKAAGTTLGADNGIGAAAMLAVLEADDVPHPPLELIFTVEEEIGLVGCNALALPITAKRLLNLDTEEDGEVYIGCSGGQITRAELPIRRRAVPRGSVRVRIEVRGLRGGHSGVNIHEQRGNSIKLLARLLAAAEETYSLRLVAFDGGTAQNAIPREADAVVAVPAREVAALRKDLEGPLTARLADELAGVEPGLKVSVKDAPEPGPGALTADDQRTLLRLVAAMPSGVQRMSLELPGLVETSNNLGVVATREEAIVLVTSQRSSRPSGLDGMSGAVAALFELAGARAGHENKYPGWLPDPKSPIVERVRSTMRDVLGLEPALKAIHAGLECGIIGKLYPGIDMASFGPTIINAHSPDERLRIDTVPRFWKVLVAVLAALK